MSRPGRRLCFIISDELHDKLKYAAIEHKTTITKIVTEGTLRYLNDLDREKRKGEKK